MIVINVDSDEEEAAVREAQEAGSLYFGACSYVIRRGHRSIGGGGQSTVTVYAGSHGSAAIGGGAGGTGTSTVVRHDHGPADPCPPSCPGYSGHDRLDPDPYPPARDFGSQP